MTVFRTHGYNLIGIKRRHCSPLSAPHSSLAKCWIHPCGPVANKNDRLRSWTPIVNYVYNYANQAKDWLEWNLQKSGSYTGFLWQLPLTQRQFRRNDNLKGATKSRDLQTWWDCQNFRDLHRSLPVFCCMQYYKDAVFLQHFTASRQRIQLQSLLISTPLTLSLNFSSG